MQKIITLTTLISIIFVFGSLIYYSKPPLCGCQDSRGFPLKYYAEEIKYDVNNPIICTMEERICPLTSSPIEMGSVILYPIRISINFIFYFLLTGSILLILKKFKR